MRSLHVTHLAGELSSVVAAGLTVNVSATVVLAAPQSSNIDCPVWVVSCRSGHRKTVVPVAIFPGWEACKRAGE